MRGKELFGAVMVCGLLGSTALHAQVRSTDVWQGWKDFAFASGQVITTVSEVQSGDTLVVTGMTFTNAMPDAKIVGTLDEVRFRDLGDGTVEVTMSPRYPVSIDTKNDEGQPISIGLELTQTNLVLLVGGTPDAMRYDFSADQFALVSTSVTEAGAALPVSASVAATGVSGNYLVLQKPADMFDLQSAFNAASLAIAVKAKDDEVQSDLVLDAALSQFAVVSGGSFGANLDMEQVADALKAGFATETTLSYGPVTYKMDVVDGNGPSSVKGKSDGGTFGLALDKTRLAFKAADKGVEAIMTSTQIPFPEVAVRYAESAFDFLMPVSAAPDPQDYRLVTKIAGLTVSDEIWGMFDPTASLPRDPATLNLETSGKATLSVDIMNEAAMEALGDAPPGQLLSLDMPALLLSIAGAELTGTGALTFDNTDLTTFDGMPAPTGKVDLKLVGGNSLLDKLIALGYVPEDQAMGVRMMMGMFARPGDGPDTLTSTLEFKDKGFFANGMQLQ